MRRLADLTKDLEKLGEETVRAQLMRGDYGLPGTGNATYYYCVIKKASRSRDNP